MKRLKNLRQGQTRWKVVVYEPGKLQGYDDQYVAAVYLCFVTAVRGTTVNYQSGNDHYICGREWFIKNTAQTYRKALAQARQEINLRMYMNIVEHKVAEKTAEKTARYFHFSQNNSGGSFVVSDSVAHHVIVQAYDAKDANRIAENIGIYFNGCDTGADCDCCGDRWGEQWVNEQGEEKPLIYGEDPVTIEDVFTKPGQPVCHVYHIDGSKTTYYKPNQE